jgi:glucan phosphorylase
MDRTNNRAVSVARGTQESAALLSDLHPICKMTRKELKDSSDSLSVSRSRTASVRIFKSSRQVSSKGASDFTSCTPLISAYVDCQDQVSATFLDKEKWAKMSSYNMARMGRFSSDRAVQEYCRNIWDVTGIQ